MKNPRFVFGIIAFAVTFIFAAGIVRIIYPSSTLGALPGVFNKHQFDSPVARGLEEFIRRDERNGLTNRYGWENGAVSYRGAYNTMTYWERSVSMDASRFPEDFQAAWHEHMNAWHDFARFLDENKGKRMDRVDFDVESDRYDAEISRTWAEVIRIARANGAHVR